uniref:guanylate cyclase n=1 Tax=Heterorhabditis bacteriophora TaxID=37862 RepID=A0A1I7XU48_HETBA
MVSTAGVGSGIVMLDDLAERVPFYSAFFVDEARNQVMPIANMTPSLITNCDGMKTSSGCFLITVTDVASSFWPSVDGNLPADEPACGFKGERCDYTLIISTFSGAVTIMLIIFGAWLLRRHCETRSLDRMPWRIFRDDMRIVDEDQVKSMLSLGSQRTKMSNMNNVMTKHHAIIGVNTHATFHMYEQRRPIKFGRTDLVLLMRMKQAVHDNLNPFLGMAFNEKSEMLLLWKFCSRGTLQDLIYNDQFELDSKFHGAFVRDITLGLEYLHSSLIGFHGSLTSWATLIDRNWLVKLTDYGIADPLLRWEKHGSINTESLKEGDEKSGSTQKTGKHIFLYMYLFNSHLFTLKFSSIFMNTILYLKLNLLGILYIAPEVRMSNDKNQKRKLDQNWLNQSYERRRSADIYAFGVVIYEILFRTFPFSEKLDLNELVNKAKDGEKICRPQIQKDKQIHPDLQALLQLVKERTGMLEEATVRADKLLSQLLPGYVANELKNGRPVPPKIYPSATVLFSDVVGFTRLCGSSTPMEVVNLLNSVYSGFDGIINKHEGYKVETIGDAYMVVSGIPEENGKRHICNIADIALEIMEVIFNSSICFANLYHVYL